MRRILCIAQIIIYFISLIIFVISSINEFNQRFSFINTILSIGFICYVVFLIYVNIAVISGKKLELFLRIIIWTNFLQIFYLSLLGFQYSLSLGMQVTPYLNYASSVKLGIYLDFFNIRFIADYLKDDNIFVGINFIPLILCLLFNKVYKDFKSDGSFDVIDGQPIKFN